MAVRPNLVDYETTCASFSWADSRRLLDGLPGGRGLNIAHEAVDRHLQGPAPDRVALLGFGRTWLGAAVAPKELRFIGDLPHTKSGKIMRRLLKAREFGLPEGDVSTLQKPEEP